MIKSPYIKILVYELIVVVVFFCATAQAQTKVVFAKSFVKKDRVLLRWAPSDKKVFDVALKNGYKITRFEKTGTSLTSSVVLSNSLLPYSKQDTMKWAILIRDSKNGIVAYRTIHSSEKGKSTDASGLENEKMFYSMFLLSCDFDNKIAKASGLFFIDSTVNNSKSYLYKIEVNNLPVTYKYIPSSIEVNTAVLSSDPVIKNLSVRSKNRIAKLKWKATDYTNDFSGYNVERSSDSINYNRVNISPVILIASQFEKKKDFIYFDDTLPKINTKFFYRIRGINHFGEESIPSNVVSAVGFESLNSFPIIDSIRNVQNKRIFISYRMQNSKEDDKPKEFFISRSKKEGGPYEKIFVSKGPSVYYDEQPESVNYYKIGAVCYNGDTLFSYPYMALIADTIPPVPPTGLKAKVDAKGNVTLTWDKNQETDVQGYKILKSNALHEEFVQINNEFALETVYKDKLNLKTLTKTIYYSVVATDKRYNNSNKCTPIEVKRPDTISPVKPIITNLDIQPKGILVNWINSSSEDVKYYVLYRSTEVQTKEVKLKEWLAKDSLKQFLDTTTEMGLGYKYRLLVSDEDDNISISNNPYLKFETGYRKKISNISSEVDRTLKTVKLKWIYNASDVEKYVLYRCKKGGQLTIVKTLSSKTQEFTDTTLNIGNIYEYRIKPVYTNGAEGIISDAVIVEY